MRRGLRGRVVWPLTSHKAKPRVAFGALLERGLLKPGQKLFLGESGKETAVVLASGALKWGGMVGSIHQVGTAIQKAPCNGWEHWYYADQKTKARKPIDTLRHKYVTLLKEGD